MKTSLYMVYLCLIVCAGCVAQTQSKFEFDEPWDSIISADHIASVELRTQSVINCGAHDLRRQPNQDRFPSEVRRCLDYSIRQKIPFKVAIVWVSGDMLIQSVFFRSDIDNDYWYSDLATGIPDGDRSFRTFKCESAKIEWEPIFFDINDCTSVPANEWLGRNRNAGYYLW